MTEGLRMHKAYAAVKPSLADKQPRPVHFKTPLEYPSLGGQVFGDDQLHREHRPQLHALSPDPRCRGALSTAGAASRCPTRCSSRTPTRACWG